MANTWFETHRGMLDAALVALQTREYWSPYPEAPSRSIYGADAPQVGLDGYEKLLGRNFPLEQPATEGWVGAEQSPYGPVLGVTYPKAKLDDLLDAVAVAQAGWADVDLETRAGVCIEILQRLNQQSFLLGHATMHTTGQAFPMAFQAGGSHAQDRGLEAVAYAYQAIAQIPAQALWEKPQGKHRPIRLQKTFRVVPRGIGLVIGCSTFPTWNSYPGVFANLMTGNAVVWKPHPAATLPVALTIQVAREVLVEAGLDPNIIVLAMDDDEKPVTKTLVQDARIDLIDFTGGPVFGEWLEQQAKQRPLFTEKAGVNSMVIDSTDDFAGMIKNIAFSLSLYAGQMCTAPQNIYIPDAGIATDEGHKTFDDVAKALARQVKSLLVDNQQATSILGCIQNPATVQRVEAARQLGEVLLDSQPLIHPDYSDARILTPLLLSVDAVDEAAFFQEQFGPIVFLIRSKDTTQALALTERSAIAKGAITFAVYSTREEMIAKAGIVSVKAGVALSCNLTGNIYVNQAAAFSDFHVSGANPAGNASFCDPAFVANRYRIVQSRIPVKG